MACFYVRFDTSIFTSMAEDNFSQPNLVDRNDDLADDGLDVFNEFFEKVNAEAENCNSSKGNLKTSTRNVEIDTKNSENNQECLENGRENSFDGQKLPNEEKNAAEIPHINSEPSTSASFVPHLGPSMSGISSNTSQKVTMGQAPKRKNLRYANVMPDHFSAAALEERKREEERQNRLQAYIRQAQAQHMHEYFPPYNLLSPEEKAQIAQRAEEYRRFESSVRSKPSTSADTVVTLSSDEDDDEDDVHYDKRPRIVLDSDESDCVCLGSDEERNDSTVSTSTIAETVADHVNDAFNVPDAEGRVLINVGHPESEGDIFLSPHLTGVIKPHQIGGLRFMYDNIIETLHKYSPNGGFGCILAHSMGLGKTFQVVSFVDVLYRETPAKRVLIIVPVNTLHNWLHEFEMWLPKLSLTRDGYSRQFDVHVIGETCKTLHDRVAVVDEWYKRKGVLLLGYEMFRLLTNKLNGVGPKKSKSKDMASSELPQHKLTEASNALFDPGPDLVICDEGHRIKNFQSHTTKALSGIRTKRRIVLTGYPLQNNLIEYWCMVNFVRPNYLGTRQEFTNFFERPIKNGQCVDSTAKDIKLMRYRTHVLTNLLKGFVQRRTHSLLSTTLPPKCEYVLFLRKSPIQHRLYRRFIIECNADYREETATWNPIKAFAVACKIWNHPDVLYKALKNHVDTVEDDLDLGNISSSAAIRNKNMDSSDADVDALTVNGLWPFRAKKEAMHLNYRWAEDLFENYNPGIIENGLKMQIALNIIDRSVRRDDKLLLFSQSLLTLDVIETFLSTMCVPGTNEPWKKNRNYFRLDGSTHSMERQRLIARFNNERGVHLFLISTRAGSLGINLIGANRVIVFDASFNPCHDAQAVCRVYRYGQKKPTFIYRLVADNCMEKMIFNRQLGKKGIADRVVDERLVDAAICRQDLYDLLQYNEEMDMITENLAIDKVQINDELLLDVCRDCIGCLSQPPVEHESLMLDRSDQPLSESEKREAKRSYEREKKMLKKGGLTTPRYAASQLLNDTNFRGGFPNYNNQPDFNSWRHQNWSENSAPTQYTPMPMALRPNAVYGENNGYSLVDPQWQNTASMQPASSHAASAVSNWRNYHHPTPYGVYAFPTTTHMAVPQYDNQPTPPGPNATAVRPVPARDSTAAPELITLSDDEM